MVPGIITHQSDISSAMVIGNCKNNLCHLHSLDLWNPIKNFSPVLFFAEKQNNLLIFLQLMGLDDMVYRFVLYSYTDVTNCFVLSTAVGGMICFFISSFLVVIIISQMIESNSSRV